MEEWLKELLKAISTVTIVVGALVYVSKQILGKILDSILEGYKSKLHKEQVEHQIKYSKLYEERGSVVKEMHKKIRELEKSLHRLVTLYQGAEWRENTERESEVKRVCENLEEYLEENRIFFSEDICGLIDKVIEEGKKTILKITNIKSEERRLQRKITQGQRVEDINAPLDAWIELDKEARKKIKEAKLNLADQFRIIIGVEK